MDMGHALECGWDKVDSIRREVGAGGGPLADTASTAYVEALEATVAGQEAARLMNTDAVGRAASGLATAVTGALST